MPGSSQSTAKSWLANRALRIFRGRSGAVYVSHHLQTHTRPGSDALVFPGTNGQPLTPGQVHGHAPRQRGTKQHHAGTGYYRARAEIGRPDFRFHDLRHFAATMAAISGATTKELMAFAGHNDIHVAMRYQEALNHRKRELAQRMAALASVADPETAR